MVTQAALDGALRAAILELATDLGAGQLEEDPRGGLRLRFDDVLLGLLGSPRTHEIEWWLELPGTEQARVHSDVVQEWQGDPVRAYQFNDSNVENVAAMVVRDARRALDALRETPARTLQQLAAAEARLVERSRLARIKEEARIAWARRDYALVRTLYRSVAGALTPLEAKRLQVADRELGSPSSR